MNKSERKEIYSQIMNTKVTNIEEKYLVFIYYLQAYLRCIMTFGINSSALAEVNKVWNDFIAIQQEERKIHKVILKQTKHLEASEIMEYLDYLELINEETIKYIYDFFDDALEACDLGREYRIKCPPKDFFTLIETNEYLQKLSNILISQNDAYMFLGTIPGFTNFLKDIDKKIISLDHHFEENHDFYGVNYKTDENNTLKDIKVFIPTIINLETAIIYVHVCYSAFRLYQLLNQNITNDDLQNIYYESLQKAEEFKDVFIKKQKALLKK